MRVYISGPMFGYEDYNLHAFREAKRSLDEVGFEGVNPGHRGVTDGHEWHDYMRDAIDLLFTCEGIALLPGWMTSRGARIEESLARSLGMSVDTLDGWIDS